MLAFPGNCVTPNKREGEQIMSEVNRVWRLRKRPTGAITDDVLRFEEEALPEPSEGEFLFRLNYSCYALLP